MSNLNDPYFSGELDEKAGSPPPASSTSQRGCLFYGCLGALILGAIGAVLLAVAGVSLYRFGSKMIEQYTATEAEPVPIVELPEEEVKAIESRVEAFKEEAETGLVSTLRLTADEINGLIAENPNLRGRVAISIEGDQLHGRLSVPLEVLGLPNLLFGGLKGRFLNGEARFTPMPRPQGGLSVRVDELIVKGQPAPQEFLDQLNSGDTAIQLGGDDTEHGGFFDRVEHIEIQDGVLILTARPEESEPASADNAPENEDSGEADRESAPEAEADADAEAEPDTEAAPAEAPAVPPVPPSPPVAPTLE